MARRARGRATDQVIGRGKGWTMLLGDCVEVMARFSAGEFAHVITDPPYELETHTKHRRIRSSVDGRMWKKGDRKRGGVEVVALDFEPIDEATRKASVREFGRVASRWVLVFCQAEGAHLWKEAGEEAGLVHKRIGVWVKPDGMPQLTGDRPAVGYEAIEMLHASPSGSGKSRWNGGGKRCVFTHATRWRPELGKQAYRRGGRGDVEDHFTTKPLSLMLELVELFTDPGERVLDPFAGSGTTGVACLRLGREFVGVEKERRWFDLACEKLRAEERGTTVAAARAGQEVLFR